MNLRPVTIIAYLLLSGIFMACEDENKDSLIGSNLDTSDFIQTVFTDTIEVETAVLETESPITQNSGRLLFGGVDEGDLGITKATSYLGVSIGADEDLDFKSEAEDGEQMVYHKLKLSLGMEYFYGDTASEHSIKVFELADTLNRTFTSDVFYSAEDEVDIIQTPIGEKTFSLGDTVSTNRIEIELDDILGQRLFDYSGENEFSNQEAFRLAFNGIRIELDGEVVPVSAGWVVGASLGSSGLVLEYEKQDASTGDPLDTLAYTFGWDTHFNNISFERGSYFDGWEDESIAISTSELENRGFVIRGTGLTTKINFPNLGSLYAKHNGQIMINKAELQISALSPTGDDDALKPNDEATQFILPPSNIYFSTIPLSNDKNSSELNKQNGQTVFVSGEFQSGSELLELIYSSSTQNYAGVVFTTYLQNKLEAQGQEGSDTDNGLVLLPTAQGSSVNKCIFADQESSVMNPLNGENSALRLVVNYTVFEEADNQ